MRKILGVVLVVLVIVAVAPFGFGFWADARLNALLEDFNQADVFDFTVIKTDKGWFSSTAIIEAELSIALAQKLNQAKGDGANLNPPKVVLKSTVFHGPLPFMSGQFSLKPVVATIDTKFVKDVNTEEPLVNIDYTVLAHMNLGGDTAVVLDIPEWSGPLGDGEDTVEWQGLTGKIDLAEGLDAASMDVKAPLLKISSDKGGLLVKSLSIKSDSEAGIAGLSLGNAHFSIGNIEFSSQKPGENFSIADVQMKADTTATAGNINSQIDFKMARLMLVGEQYGPAVFSIGLKNIEAESLARINDKVKEVRGQGLPQDQASMMMGATIMSELSNLLKQGPEIEIAELSLVSTVGKLMGNARISVDTSRPELLTNMFLVKDAIVGELDIEVPEEMMVLFNMGILKKELQGANIQYTDEQLKTMAKSRVNKRMGALVKANMFTKAGNMYRMTASFEKGVPTVNGRIIPIPFGGGAPVAPLQ